MVDSLLEKIGSHAGEFLCETRSSEPDTKQVRFCHKIEPPKESIDLPKVDGIHEFYSKIGSLTLYYCSESDEAACYLAHPVEWESLEEGIADWVYLLDEDEEEEILPTWFESHKVIGEIPGSGNYILLVTSGDESGSLFLFDHDGFEFTKVGATIEEFVLNTLDPDPEAFAELITYMCFMSGSSSQQWWARELHHNSGKIVRNSV